MPPKSRGGSPGVGDEVRLYTPQQIYIAVEWAHTIQ